MELVLMKMRRILFQGFLLLRVLHRRQQDRTDAVRAALKREGLKLNLEDLPESKLGPSENEIRVWVGLGVLVPRCFVFKSGNDLRQASYVTIQDSAARTKVLNPPQSGWPAFDRLLKAHNLTSPLELKSDAQYEVHYEQ
jgi:hypothetical protein